MHNCFCIFFCFPSSNIKCRCICKHNKKNRWNKIHSFWFKTLLFLVIHFYSTLHHRNADEWYVYVLCLYDCSLHCSTRWLVFILENLELCMLNVWIWWRIIEWQIYTTIEQMYSMRFVLNTNLCKLFINFPMFVRNTSLNNKFCMHHAFIVGILHRNFTSIK